MSSTVDSLFIPLPSSICKIRKKLLINRQLIGDYVSHLINTYLINQIFPRYISIFCFNEEWKLRMVKTIAC